MVILIPIMRGVKPDENEAMHKKATYIVERIINELSTDEYLYPRSGEFNGLANTSPVKLNGESHGGSTKFCTLFASRINKKPGTEVNCERNKVSVTSVEGIDWYLPVSDFQDGTETLIADVNGSEEPNKIGVDRFEYKIQPGLKVPVVEIPNLAPTAAPPGRPGIGAPPAPADETKTGLESYSISCNAANATVFGNGENKVNGNYTLVAIPRKGYKCSWFTKQVTVKDRNVTNADCNLTCDPDTLRPTPDGETVTPPPPPPPPPPEETYCINVTMTGEADKCTVTGTGCEKPNGIYEVTLASKDEKNYKPSWISGKSLVTINDADVNMTAECSKIDKAKVTVSVNNSCEGFVLDYKNNPISQSYKSENVTKSNTYNTNIQYWQVEDTVGTEFTLTTPASAKFCSADLYDAGGCKGTLQTCTFKSWRASGGADVSTKTEMKGNVGTGSVFAPYYECPVCTEPGSYTITVTDNIKRTYKSAYYYEDHSDVTIETDHKELSGLSYVYKTEKMMFKSGDTKGQRHGTSNVTVNQGATTNYWVLTHEDCAPTAGNCTSYEDRLATAEENYYNTTNYKIKVGSTVIYDSKEKANIDVEYKNNKYSVKFVENFTDGVKPPSGPIKITVKTSVYPPEEGECKNLSLKSEASVPSKEDIPDGARVYVTWKYTTVDNHMGGLGTQNVLTFKKDGSNVLPAQTHNNYKIYKADKPTVTVDMKEYNGRNIEIEHIHTPSECVGDDIGKIHIESTADSTGCSATTVFDIVKAVIHAKNSNDVYKADFTSNVPGSIDIPVKAGTYNLSYTDFDPTISCGNCTSWYQDIVVNSLNPSTVTVPANGTATATITYGCKPGAKCSINLIGKGNTGEGIYADIGISGGTSKTTRLSSDNNFKETIYDLDCGKNYSVTVKNTGNNLNPTAKVTAYASPSYISNLTGSKDVEVNFEANSIAIDIGSLSYTGGTAANSGDGTILVRGNSGWLSGLKVVPSNKSKAWRLDQIGGNNAFGPDVSNGVGDRAFQVYIDGDTILDPGCVQAKYSDGSASSNQVCFELNKDTPVKYIITKHTAKYGDQFYYTISTSLPFDVVINEVDIGHDDYQFEGNVPIQYSSYWTISANTLQSNTEFMGHPTFSESSAVYYEILGKIYENPSSITVIYNQKEYKIEIQ